MYSRRISSLYVTLYFLYMIDIKYCHPILIAFLIVFVKDTVVRRHRPSVDYRVAIDFSGNESRVVSDPDAAQALRDSLSSKLPVN